MQQRAFGNTGLFVSVIGFGATAVGNPSMPESDAERILDSVVDAGVNVIDTARSYGKSEERIGKYLNHRRSEVILSTKVGYGIPGYQDWTGACIRAGIDHALRLMQTDFIDIVHFHSCPLPVLRQEENLEALSEGVRLGKIRVAAYSGDNESLDWALHSGRFGSLQTSISVCDQRAIPAAAIAQERGIGIIAKRPLANAPWRFSEPPTGDSAAFAYWQRWHTMKLNLNNLDPSELFLRFVAYLPGVDCCLVGTGNLEHLKQNIRIVEKGKLPDDTISGIRAAFQNDWAGEI